MMIHHKHLTQIFLLSLISCLCFTKCFASLIEDEYDDSDDDDTDESVSDSHDFQFYDTKDEMKGFKKRLDLDLKRMYESWNAEDICKDVNCKTNEFCLIKSKGVAMCIHNNANPKVLNSVIMTNDKVKSNNNQKSKRITSKSDTDNENRVEDANVKSTYAKSENRNKLKHCKPCPVVKSEFVCGSDNTTYSSSCRLEFHNCVHDTHVKLACNGFCPCHYDKPKNDVMGNDRSLKLKQKKGHKFDANKKVTNNNVKKFDNDFFDFDEKPKLRNSVLIQKQKPAKTTKNSNICTDEELRVMGTRLIDWFSVVVSDQKRKHTYKKTIGDDIPGCESNVSWMFHHFDTDSDLRLSIKELYYLEHDDREKCLKPYLIQCDEDNDDYLNPYEWCTCFDYKSHRCAKDQKRAKKGVLGAYIPQCDKNGFYKLTQCHSSIGVCWCVDKNGIEFVDTRRKGIPDCRGMLKKARQRSNPKDVDAEDDDDDDDFDDDGSGDGIDNP